MIEDALDKLSELFAFRMRAEKTLSDPGIVQAFKDVRQSALESFEGSAPKDNAIRENAYWMLRALDGLEVALQNRINAHEVEKMVRDKQDERREQRERIMRRVS